MQKCMGARPAWGIDEERLISQASAMSRRTFLSLLPSLGVPGLLSAACAPNAPLAPPPRAERRAHRKLRAICFDLFTLFDPRSVVPVASELFGERAPELCDAWRVRQFEYAWLRLGAGQYVDFETVTAEALEYAAAARGLALSSDARRRLVAAYSQLTPWPDAQASLARWQDAGLLLAPLANYSPRMLDALLRNAGFSQYFTTQISTDLARTFKPAPAAYALGESRLRLAREEIAFAAFGGWDAAGAKWFGFPTFWVNRLGVERERLIEPDASGPTLAELNQFVTSW
jgi:2-haloacid dehalogenase